MCYYFVSYISILFNHFIRFIYKIEDEHMNHFFILDEKSNINPIIISITIRSINKYIFYDTLEQKNKLKTNIIFYLV